MADSMLGPPSGDGSDGKGWERGNSTLDGCGLRRYTKSDRDASGLYGWLRNELKEYNKHAKDEWEFIQHYLIPKYAPTITPQMTACYVDRDCDVSPFPQTTCLLSYIRT